MSDAPVTSNPPSADCLLDAGEAACAELLIHLVRTMRRLPDGAILEVVAHSRSARHDIPAWCRMTRNHLLHTEVAQPTHFFIQKGER